MPVPARRHLVRRTAGGLALVAAAAVAAFSAAAPAAAAAPADPGAVEAQLGPAPGLGGAAAATIEAVSRTGVWTTVRSGEAGAGASRRLPVRAGVPLAGWWGGSEPAPGSFAGGVWSLGADPALTGTTEVRFGAAGDRPLVADLDRDGRSDLIVFAAGRWRVRLSSGSHPVLAFSYGRAGDRPVAGDVDGDGRVDVGVVRGNRWYLHSGAGGGATRWQFVFGAAGDPVYLADVDGDGRADPFVTHGGTLSVRGRSGTVRLAVPAGQPVVVHAPAALPAAGPDCPAASLDLTRPLAVAPASQALPWAAAPDDALSGPIRQALGNELRYLLGTDRAAHYPAAADHSYLDVLHTTASTEIAVRTPANIAYTVATAVYSGGYDPAQTGVSAPAALDYARTLALSVACQHVANMVGGWGLYWQSSYWAELAGIAAWTMWDGLTGTQRSYVARMVAAEADDRAGATPYYYRDRAGRIVRPGNSGGEEDAWQAQVESLAALMMPTSSHAAGWRAAATRLLVAATAVPADLASTEAVGGSTVGALLAGSNLNEDGTMVNHGRVAPDYLAADLGLSANTLLMARMSAAPPIDGAARHADLAYRSLTTVLYPASQYHPPGGTVYQPDGTIYAPQDNDWGDSVIGTFWQLDTAADRFGWDTGAATPAADWAGRHIAVTLAMQARAADGRTYQATTENRYPGREAAEGNNYATAWLLHTAG